jgi:hypothetical protein
MNGGMERNAVNVVTNNLENKLLYNNIYEY